MLLYYIKVLQSIKVLQKLVYLKQQWQGIKKIVKKKAMNL